MYNIDNENDICIVKEGVYNMAQTIQHINLYQEFMSYSYEELQNLFKEAKTKEEQDFYMTLANLLLRKQQKKVIESENV